MVAPPELLGAFDSSIDLLDRRLDVAAGQRQTATTIFGIVHPLAMVRVIRHGTMDALSWIGFAGVLIR